MKFDLDDLYSGMTFLTIHPKPSFRLAKLLGSAHLVALFLICSLPFFAAVKMMSVGVLMISMIYYLRKNALLNASDAIEVLVLSDEMPCQLTLCSGESYTCSILENSFVTPFLIVINLKLEGKFFPQSLVILADSLDMEESRQLRTWLRWNKRILKKT